MERGEPTWHTRSTAPTSMPSSSDAVATHTFTLPAFSRCSASRRISCDRLPWCAATAFSPRRSDIWCASRSTSRRVFTNRMVVWCSRTSSATLSRAWSHCSCVAMGPISSSGSSSARSISREWPVSTIRQSGFPSGPTFAAPTRNRPTSSIGRWVADRPMRVIGPSASLQSRSTERLRCEPRLSSATA